MPVAAQGLSKNTDIFVLCHHYQLVQNFTVAFCFSPHFLQFLKVLFDLKIKTMMMWRKLAPSFP